MSIFERRGEGDSIVDYICDLHSFVLTAVAEAGGNDYHIVDSPSCGVLDYKVSCSGVDSLKESGRY